MNEPPDRDPWAREWLAFAEGDLSAAATLMEGGRHAPRHACWNIQQAVEKAIKAVLTLEGVDFPHIHDLEELQELLPPHWQERMRTTLDLALVSTWSTGARYPGLMAPISEEDVRAAWQEAEVLVGRVRDTIDDRLGDTGPRPPRSPAPIKGGDEGPAP